MVGKYIWGAAPCIQVSQEIQPMILNETGGYWRYNRDGVYITYITKNLGCMYHGQVRSSYMGFMDDGHLTMKARIRMSVKINPDYILVGGSATPLKNMNVNWDDYSQYMGK